MRTVLAVDDNAQNVYLLETMLRAQGYQVLTATNGAEALDQARKTPPDLVVADILMPVMDGFQLCREWKRDERLKAIPFVFYTATYTDPKDEQLALALGADRFIVKPQEPATLLETLRDVLAAQDAGRLAVSDSAFPEETTYYREYNEALVRKLERKMLQVEQTKESLEREVAEHRRTLEELRLAHERLRCFVDANIIGIVIGNTAGEILEANDYYLNLVGCTRDDLAAGHLTWRSSTPPESLAIDERAIQEVRQRGVSSPYEKDYIRPDGTRVSVLLANAMLPGSGEEIAAFVLDITERLKLAEQLQQAQKMESIGRLAGGVAHDFNNALTPLLAISGSLLKDLSPQHPLHQDLTDIHKAGERCAALTRQLLAFSRHQSYEPTVLDLNVVVTDITRMLGRVIGEDIEMTTCLDPAVARVKADVGQMEQVIVNLVVNARDAMPHGGQLTIKTMDVTLDQGHPELPAAMAPGRYVMLAIADTGTGMDAHTKARIFEPFFTTKEKGRGTGLGLSTVYGIVKQSGGGIRVESEPGRGATFTMCLPALIEDSAGKATVEAAPAELARGPETVLVVEDDDAVRAVATRVLRACGYVVLEASGGAEAFRISDNCRDPIHLLVTDIVMPGLGGGETANRLLASRPDMKVLFTSGYSDGAGAPKGIPADGAHFLRKPFTAESLAEAVQRALDGA